ncbi:MAG: PKD domain-containing protein, partial [Lysobacterales bacterium]
SFTYVCNDLSCDFTDSSSDSDGSVVSWSWNFGDGGTSTSQNPSHTFAAGGSYNVTLTVTDNLGATDADSQSVSVSTDYTPELIGSAEMTSNSRWKATVEDLNGGLLQGSWSESGTPGCTDSVCTLSNIHKRVLSVTFTADGSGAQITVYKP